MLSDLCRGPGVQDAVADLLREAMPEMVAVFVPPGWDRDYTESSASRSRTSTRRAYSRWRPSCAPPAFRSTSCRGRRSRWTSPRASGRERVDAARGGILGEKVGPPSRDPESSRCCSTRSAARWTRSAPAAPVTIQWEFPDFGPSTCASTTGRPNGEAGYARHAGPDLSKCRYADWVDVTGGRTDPRLAMLRGRSGRGEREPLWRPAEDVRRLLVRVSRPQRGHGC